MKVRVERQIGASILSIETGELAKQAAGSCLVQYGETVVLAASRLGRRPAGRFLPADLRLSRARGGGGQVPRRLPQTRRPADHQGNPHGPADGPPHPPAVSRRVPRRSADAGLRDGQRPAERRRRAGDERRLGRAAALAAAVPRADRLGPPGLHRRRVRPLPHARRPGRKRSGPDRLGQPGLDPDDRGLCPRNARRPHGRGHRRRARIYPPNLRDAGRTGREGGHGQEAVRSRRRPTACSTRCGRNTTTPSAPPSRPAASWPAPTPATRVEEAGRSPK